MELTDKNMFFHAERKARAEEKVQTIGIQLHQMPKAQTQRKATG